MTGTCCGSTCEEGKRCFAQAWRARERVERWIKKKEREKERVERREMFTEAEPERQTEKEYNLFFPLRSVCSLSAQSS